MALQILGPSATRDSDLFDAAHRWNLPGVRCHRCGEWGTVGLSYPDIDFSASALGPLLNEPRLVDMEEFRSLKEQIDRVTGRKLYLLPGTDFGPLTGDVFGPAGEVAWQNPWTMLFTDRIASTLEEGFDLPELVPATLDGTGGQAFLEPAIGVVEVLPDHGACTSCGRPSASRQQIVDALASFEPTHDLMRIAEFSTMIVCTDEFANALTALSDAVVIEPISG